ncbi:MAG: hypothetical protein FWD52_08350 [Candidatus Bathyarchaeota archaeon]|nr:hypothetical protein [Candidatus Termiticorpusculum sp.]
MNTVAEIKRFGGLHVIKVKVGEENLCFWIILALCKALLDAGFVDG